jgi:hypothetical protein
LTEIEETDWRERLRLASAEALRRREARAAARRAAAERRRRGMSERQGWRQARLDARRAEREFVRPPDA